MQPDKKPEHEAQAEYDRERLRIQQQVDQKTEEMLNLLPNIWYRMYLKLQEEGFDKPEAMSIVHEYMRIGFLGGRQ